MPTPDQSERTLPFASFSEPRDLWWHRLPRSNYVPPVYASLTDDEWCLMRDWFEATTRENLVGECGIPLMSLLHGLIMGSSIRRVVQLGTAAGYSTLLLGFYLRQMNANRGLITFEIMESLCQFANRWIEQAGLSSFVQVEHRSSLDSSSPEIARLYLDGAPELVFLDSSHEYQNTLMELDLWFQALAPGGLIVLHDTSRFAESFDVTQHGGAGRAFREWRRSHPEVESFSLNDNVRAMKTPEMIYQDFCGAGLIQKPV